MPNIVREVNRARKGLEFQITKHTSLYLPFSSLQDSLTQRDMPLETYSFMHVLIADIQGSLKLLFLLWGDNGI